MTENIKGQEPFRVQVQNAVKKCMIDTKFENEGISFGQAVVTHHFLNAAAAGLNWQTA
jgi:hypothetical protein